MDNNNLIKNAAGFVYLLINASMPGMVKIGRTTRDPENRIEELSKATGVPTPFILVYKEFFSDCINAESVIHEMLEDKGYRLSPNREFFTVPIPNAISIIQNTSENLNAFTKNTPIISNKKNNAKGQLHNYKMSDLDQLKESLVVSGEKYLSGEGDYLQDKKKAFKDLEQAGKLGSARAYYVMGMTYFDSYSDYGDKTINTEKPLDYFEKGAKLSDADSRFCVAEMAKIYMGIYDGYFNEYEINHNSKVCWDKYTDKIKGLHYPDLEEKDTEYLLFYISHVLSNRIEALYNLSSFDDFFNENRDLFRIINWMNYELKAAIVDFTEEYQDYDEIQSEKDEIYQYQFMEILLQTYFPYSEPCEINQIRFMRESANGTWFEISLEQGKLKVGDIIKLIGPITQYTKVLEIRQNNVTITELKDIGISDVLLDCFIDIEKDFAEVKLIKTGEYEYIYDKHYLEIQKDQVWLDRLCNHLIDTAKIKRYSSGYDNEWIKYYEKAGELGSVLAYELLAKEVYNVQEKETIRVAIEYYEQGAQLNERGKINCLSGVAKIYQYEYENDIENFDFDTASYYWNKYIDGTTFSNFSYDTKNFIYWYILVFNYEIQNNTSLNKNENIIVLTDQILKILNWFKQDFRETLNKQLFDFSKQQSYLIELTKSTYSYRHGLTYPEIREQIENYTNLIDRIKHAELFFDVYFDFDEALVELEVLSAPVQCNTNIFLDVILKKGRLQVGDIFKGNTTSDESYFNFKKIWNVQDALKYEFDHSYFLKVLEISIIKTNKKSFQDNTLYKVKLEKSSGLFSEEDLEIINDDVDYKLIKVGASFYTSKMEKNQNVTANVVKDNIKKAQFEKNGSKSEFIESNMSLETKENIINQQLEIFGKILFENK